MVRNGPHAGINFSSVSEKEEGYCLVVDEAPLVKCTLCGFHNDGIPCFPVKRPERRKKFSEMKDNTKLEGSWSSRCLSTHTAPAKCALVNGETGLLIGGKRMCSPETAQVFSEPNNIESKEAFSGGR